MKDRKKILQHPDHPAPVTRRQFLSRGIIDSSAMMLVPSLFVTRETQAGKGICHKPAATMMPFLLFDCAGGAALSGNFVVGGSGGSLDFLSSYDTMGIPNSPAKGEPIDVQFGAPLFSNLSKFREGLLTSTSGKTRRNLKMATLCNASQDDSSNNLLSPLLLTQVAGLKGRLISNPLGTQNTDSGGRSKSPFVAGVQRPIHVSGASSVVKSFLLGKHIQSLDIGRRKSLMNAMAKLSGIQLSQWNELRGGTELGSLVHCAHKKNLDFISPPASVDPRLNALATEIYELKPNSSAAFSAVTYNVLNGNSGGGTITIGGCDYHDGTQNTGDTKDLEIGTQVGRAVELAARMGRPLFFAIVSDGSCYSDKGTRIWRGDSGSKGLAVMGFYHPTHAPEVVRTQIGYYGEGQGVERSTFIGATPKRVAYAIFANYLAVQGKLGDFTQHISEREFQSDQISQHMAFV